MINIPRMLKIASISNDIDVLSKVEKNLFLFLCEPVSVQIINNVQFYYKDDKLYYTYVIDKHMVVLSDNAIINPLIGSITSYLLADIMQHVLNTYGKFDEPINIYHSKNVFITY